MIPWEQASAHEGQLKASPVGSRFEISAKAQRWYFSKIDSDLWIQIKCVDHGKTWTSKSLINEVVQHPQLGIESLELRRNHIRRAKPGELLFAVLCNPYRVGVAYAFYHEDLTLAELNPFLPGVATNLCKKVIRLHWNEVGTLLHVTRVNSSGYRVQEEFPASVVVNTTSSFSKFEMEGDREKETVHKRGKGKSAQTA